MRDALIIDDKNENIEILRAVAIIFVLIIHLGWALVFPSSTYSILVAHFDFSVGVDLFFVISGFVITRSLSHSFSSSYTYKRYIVVAFWIKRIFRLVPAAFFWLMIVVVYLFVTGELWNNQHLRLKNLIPVLAAVANIFNFYYAYCYANLTEEYWRRILFYGHYWSLSLEEQFYIVFPVVFVFFRKRVLIWLLVALITVQFFWLRPFFSYGWFFRIDAFCWGILLALLPVKSKNIIDRFLKNKTTALTAFFLIILLPFASNQVQGFGNQTKTYGVSLVASISAALVFLAVWNEKSFGTWLPYRRLMLYIGSRSYSIYLTHLIVFEIVKHSWFVMIGNTGFSDVGKKLVNIAVVILAFIIMLIASEMTYRLIELRFRIKGRVLANGFINQRLT